MNYNDFHAAYAGGLDGREVIDQFLPLVQSCLSPSGTCYMIAIEENKPQEIIQWMNKKEYGSFIGSIVLRKKVLGEILYVLKFVHSSDK
jgi:release factor glutamine methyltransferase